MCRSDTLRPQLQAGLQTIPAAPQIQISKRTFLVYGGNVLLPRNISAPDWNAEFLETDICKFSDALSNIVD